MLRKTAPALWLILSSSMSITLLALPQAVSPHMLEVAARVQRHIAEKRPGWNREAIQPIEGSKDITVDQWRAGTLTVRVSLIMYDSPARAASSLSDSRYHTELEERAAKAQGRSNHPSIKAELNDLGTEGFVKDDPFHITIVFRKGVFSATVTVWKSDAGRDTGLAVEFARLTAEVLPGAEGDHGRAGLPPYGSFVRHPNSKVVVYYLANRPRELKPRGGRHTGLYVSQDGGRRWEFLTEDFKFKQLFIHPDTGKLFAVADYHWPPDAQVSGVGRAREADKIIASDDGRSWRDITGRARHYREGAHIFADPNHTGRISLSVFDGIRGYVLQASDDDYTEWKPYLNSLW